MDGLRAIAVVSYRDGLGAVELRVTTRANHSPTGVLHIGPNVMLGDSAALAVLPILVSL